REELDEPPGRFLLLAFQVGAHAEVVRAGPDRRNRPDVWDRRTPEIQVGLFLQVGQHVDPLEGHPDAALPEPDPGVEVLRRRRDFIFTDQFYAELQGGDILRTVQDTAGVVRGEERTSKLAHQRVDVGLEIGKDKAPLVRRAALTGPGELL